MLRFLPLTWRLGIIAAAAVVLIGGGTAAVLSWKHAIYQRGVMDERMEWTKRVTESRNAREKERREAQAAIDELTRDYQEVRRRFAEERAARDEAEAALLDQEGGGIVIPEAYLRQLREIGK